MPTYDNNSALCLTGDVLIQISENQRRLTAELEAIFRWFHSEVLQEMDNNVKLDKDYIAGSRRRYEMEVRTQATSLERQLRGGAYQDEYIHFLRDSQREALMEEERRYRFLAEKHCGLTQSIVYLMNKVTGAGGGLQQIADGLRDQVNATRGPGSQNPCRLDNTSRMREEDRWSQWSGKEEQPLGRVPSRGGGMIYLFRCLSSPMTCPPGPLMFTHPLLSPPSSLTLHPHHPPSRPITPKHPFPLQLSGGGRPMRALVSHPANSNSPTLLPFSRGEVVSVLVQDPQNSSRQGWFPAAYVGPLEEAPKSTGSSATLRSGHSMDNLLDQSGSSSHGRPPPPPPPNRQTEMHPITPIVERRAESHSDNRVVLPGGTNPFATVKLKPTSTDDRSAPRLRR
ncbi:unnamed protein product [Oncorhynchus mykiss]|uniref:IMD domain-containing protein n=1 Tax=Oncorhynchus mykiss TaxID=8022 RepID=A0A060WXR2_ONCMY|nr:unnamed protein product [Oncorhynchus mykiss]